MKVRKLLGLLTPALIFSLVSCGNGGGEASSTKKEESSAKRSSAAKSSSSKAASSSKSVPHVHSYVDDGAAKGVVHPEKCPGGDSTAYRLDIAEATGWNDPATKWNAKTAPTNEAKWDIEGKIPAGKYAIALCAAMSYDSHSDRYFYNQHETDTASQPDTAEQDPFRYFFSVDGGAAINPTTKKTWGDLGYTADKENPVYATIVDEVTIAAGAKSFSAHHGNIGYSMIVAHVRLIALPAAAAA